MNILRASTHKKILISVALFLLSLFSHNVLAAKALLPISSEVPAGNSLPIDGIWVIEALNKRVLIEQGRAIAVDPWVHAFVWEIEPDMVVQKDLVRVNNGEYKGYDLPLLGELQATLLNNGKLKYHVKGALGPISFLLRPAELTDNQWFEKELASIGSIVPPQPPIGIRPVPMPEPDPVIIPFPKDKTPFPYPIANDFTPGCGGEGQALCNNKPAIRKSKAQKLGCPGKRSHFSARNGGECWSCPKGYKRTAQFINSKKACAVKFIKGPYKRAKYQRSVWGCPKGQFHVLKGGGSCMACPKGYKRVQVAGVDTLTCDIPNKYQCDGPLKPAKLPPLDNPLANLLGSRKVKVCGIKKDIIKQAAIDLKNTAQLYYYARKLHKQLTSGSAAALYVYKGLQSKQWSNVVTALKKMENYKKLVKIAKQSKSKSITIGLGGDVQLIVGSNTEFGIAVNTNGTGRIKPYNSTGFSKGIAAGADLGIVIGVWRASSNQLDGPAQGIAASVGVGAKSGGATVWYSYYSRGTRGQEYLGFSIAGSVGIGFEIGEYNEVWTQYL
jgi:hypothetical protein